MRPANLFATAALAIATGMPPLGQQSGMALRAGSGVIRTSTWGRRQQRDTERMQAAQLKRQRKAAKRLRDWAASVEHQHPVLRHANETRHA